MSDLEVMASRDGREKNRDKETAALDGAVEWLTKVATVRDNVPVGEKGRQLSYSHWNGAIRGEYRVATREWNSFCPIWHTGQAVKALVLAAQALKRPELLQAARFSAEFILKNRVTEGPDRGLILAFEDHPDKVNTSAILESLDGLFHVSEATGDAAYGQAAIDALRWVRDHAWDAAQGKFNDIYDPAQRTFIFGIHASQGRPLLDDAVFLKGWRLTGDESLKAVAVQTGETLLRDETPSGNWVQYIPCNKERGNIHPRHAYWWGLPMLELFEATGDERFRACFLRSVEWYKRALRRDGGLIRNTYTDFNTDSFGHATSGAACAVIVFLAYLEHTGDESILEYVHRGLDYCKMMQFTNPEDPNLRGCILEKVLPPDGTDRSPYYIRDLGTIFFVQAMARSLMMKTSMGKGSVNTSALKGAERCVQVHG